MDILIVVYRTTPLRCLRLNGIQRATLLCPCYFVDGGRGRRSRGGGVLVVVVQRSRPGLSVRAPRI